ncbi:hypothetical protein DUI87_11305 [Hirundo rustica rustica]|uniref:Retroviral nucleocapsid Gag protein p24 C-terminal domain-containing protein n=1 Tax=Hirundo rustica rustica TaxID=333673 RepID=A0A3M0KG12_HIRRU|nr:hypothetical protein DUI87_11305 [Hirundo rustica rustica]
MWRAQRLHLVRAPPRSPLPAASVAAATGGKVFKFSANRNTAGLRPVFDRSKSSRAVDSSSTAWTLPPCQVTVRPRDRGQFWDEVKAKVEGLSAGAGPAMSDVQLIPSRVPASDPVGSTGQDRAGAAASSEGLQAFPVLQGVTHNTYQPLAWQALSELRDAVGKYGLGSAEVMQVLRSFNASLLTPFDIRSLARALFPPVEYDFFENKWTQLAVRAVERNRTLGPGDPRRMVNIDMLMGTGNYTRAEGQAGYEPLIQEQCQQTGMAALVQTIQLATPQQPFATIVQEIDEPFLCFAGRLTAAVEKQVSDPAARKLMIQSVAQGNCNAVCKRIIEALPGGTIHVGHGWGLCKDIPFQPTGACRAYSCAASCGYDCPTDGGYSGPAGHACGRATGCGRCCAACVGCSPRGATAAVACSGQEETEEGTEAYGCLVLLCMVWKAESCCKCV